MKRILLDQNVPAGVRRLLGGYEVSTAYERGWADLTNGRLLDEAENAGFEVFVTCDQNLRYQQNLGSRRLAVVVLDTNRWSLIRAQGGTIEAAVSSAASGTFSAVSFDQATRGSGAKAMTRPD